MVCDRRLFQAVGRIFPFQAHPEAALAVHGQLPVRVPEEACGEGVHRQGLHDIAAAVAVAQELEHALVDGAAYGEAEGRVQAVFHIREILVREQLEQHSRHIRHAGLAVGTVPELPAAPLRLESGAYVIHNLALYQLGVFPCGHPVAAVRIFAGILFQQGVYGKGAHNGVAQSGAGVGVEGEGEVHGYMFSFLLRVDPGSSCQMLYPRSPAHEIVPVVGFLFVEVPDFFVETRPLQPVAGSLCESRHSGAYGRVAASG